MLKCDIRYRRGWKVFFLLSTVLQPSTAAPQTIPQHEVIEEFDIARGGESVLVPVTVAGTARLFLVDTGASHVIYDNFLEGSLRPHGRVATVVTLSGRLQVNQFDAPAAFLGRLDLRGQDPADAAPVGCIDLAALRDAMGEEVRGIIGCCFLREHVVRLDVERGKLSFLREVGADPGVRVPMELVGGVPAILASLPGVGDRLFIVDTGYVGPSGALDVATVMQLDSMHLLARLASSKLVGAGSKEPRRSRLNRIRSFTVAGFTDNDVVFAEETADVSSCTLGLAYLSRYVVTFDFRGGALYLKPAKSFSAPDNGNLHGGDRVGISIARRNGAVIAADVVPGSPAKKAGVQVGDIVLSLDGKDVRRSPVFAIEDMFLSFGDTCQLTVRRGERTLSLTLRLRPTPIEGDASTEPPINKWRLARKWGQAELFPANARPQSTGPQATDDPETPPHNRTPHINTFTNSLGMKFTLVPAGEFTMGSDESVADIERALGEKCLKPAWIAAEQPKHRVRITRPFYFGVYEVTKEQFGRFVEAEDYITDAEMDGHGGQGYSQQDNVLARKTEYNWRSWGVDQNDSSPAVNVSWNDAVAFCQWMSGNEGKRYRLPTEAEWEYACRAGTNTRFHNGDDPERLVEIANVADGTAKETFTTWHTVKANDGFTFPCAGGQFRPNLFGLYDMTGNVGEWCADWYRADYYANSPLDDPPGPVSGSFRVIRGGGWSEFLIGCRTAFRRNGRPMDRYDYVGFRVVCEGS
jgi:formylglycine-generating enzyme